MSKVDAQRAIRDARMARFAEAKKTQAAVTTARRPKATEAPPAPEELFAAPAVTKVTAKPTRAKTKPSDETPELLTPLPVETEGTAEETAPADASAAAPEAAVEATDTAERSDEATTAPAEEASAEEAVTEELCGHRSMNGKSCTREKNHPQKNHRYN